MNRSVYFLAFAFAVACSSSGTNTSSSSGNTSGTSGSTNSGTCPDPAVLASKTSASLTADDYKLICDWTACIYGGYGKSITCTDSTVVNGPTDQATCASSPLPQACPATVSNYTGCLRPLLANQCANKDTVHGSADCQVLFSSECTN